MGLIVGVEVVIPDEGLEGESAGPLVDIHEWLGGGIEGVAAEVHGRAESDEGFCAGLDGGVMGSEGPAVVFGVCAVAGDITVGDGAGGDDFGAFLVSGGGGVRVIDAVELVERGIAAAVEVAVEPVIGVVRGEEGRAGVLSERGDDADDVVLEPGDAGGGAAGHVFDEDFVRRGTAEGAATGAVDDDAPMDSSERLMGWEC